MPKIILYNQTMSKTLIFGGAFDPPHIEHVNMCKSAMRELGIDRLVIVPTYFPPHKGAGFLSFEDRISLIRTAFDGLDFVIDDIERVREKDNYSALVLPILKQKYGDIVYLIGGDSIEHLSTWYHPEQIVSTCPIAVCAREGFDDVKTSLTALKQKYGGEYIEINYMGADVSSSHIKAQLLLGEKSEGISDEVYRMIIDKGLFDNYKDMVERLKTYQTEELFEHSKAVVLTALELNSLHNLKQDFKKVFLACLLHDNAKQRPSVDGLNVPIDAVGTPVLHQFLGAEKARRDFGITDEDILSAIRYHTTAKADMTLLERLVYTADSLSFDRQYEPIPTLRDIAMKDFEDGFRAVLKYTYDKVLKKGGNMHPLTQEAKECYLDK